MDVIYVIAPIRLVTDGMFPKPPLPYQPFVPVIGASVDLPRSGLFDLPPTAGIIGIGLRQPPDTMEMIG